MAIVDRHIGSPGRYDLDMVCLGHGTILVYLFDGSRITHDNIRITCTAEPGAWLSTELTMTTGLLRLHLQADPDTEGAFAFGTRRL